MKNTEPKNPATAADLEIMPIIQRAMQRLQLLLDAHEAEKDGQKVNLCTSIAIEKSTGKMWAVVCAEIFDEATGKKHAKPLFCSPAESFTKAGFQPCNPDGTLIAQS